MKFNKISYDLDLSPETDLALFLSSEFLKISKGEVIKKGIIFMEEYCKFKKENPKGKIYFETEKTKQEIII